MRRLVRPAAAATFAFGLVLSATGWLYLGRAWLMQLPGPTMHDALPFDELSSRGSVTVLGYVLVWTVTALLLALVVRASGAERLTAGLLIALSVGSWGYLSSATAIVVVRQVTGDQAFDAATHVRPVYIAAAIAGIGGALGGRPQAAPATRTPLVLAWVVAAVGALAVVDAALPGERHSLIAQLAPDRVRPLTGALSVPLGLALLVVARSLSRRKRRAWQLGLAALLGVTALHFVRGFNFGAAVTALAAVALVARRHDFNLRGDPEARPRVSLQLASVAFATYLYGAAALWVNRIAADQPYTLRFALRETTASLLGLRVHGSTHLGSSFGEWFPVSVLLIGVAGGAWVLVTWLAPWRHRVRQEALERVLVRDLVERWGADTLAPFVRRGDKSYFFSEDERAFLAYRVLGGVAVVSGDPIGPDSAFDDLVAAFIAFAHDRDWRVAVLGASEHRLGLYRRHGLHALYHGDEAVIETTLFSLDGRSIRKVRQSVHRLRRSGYRAAVLKAREIDGSLRAELEVIARVWRGDRPERGFTMALDALFGLEDENAVFVVGFAPDGRAAGFLHFAVCRPARALSLSSMPRLRTTPNGFNEWLVCEAVEWARRHRFERVSLNFAPFAALLGSDAELSRLQRLQRRALLRMKGRFQLDNLLRFNTKFLPSWQRRFVVYERRLDLPRIGIAALAAEAYLPFTGRRRR